MRADFFTTTGLLAAALLFTACSDTTGSGGRGAGAGGSSGSNGSQTAGMGIGGFAGASATVGLEVGGGSGSGAGGAGGASAGGAGAIGGAAADGAGAQAGAGSAGGSNIGGGAPGSRIDPKCLDGISYAAEPVPDRTINVDDLIASYTPSNLLPWVIEILNRRYPIGALGPSEAQAANDLACFNIAFDTPTPSLQVALDALNTVVHECGHRLDGSRWVIRADLEYKCDASLVANTPLRNVIMSDEFEVLGPKGGSLDFLEQVYLQGSSGMQNFPVFYTEYNQYVNQMGSAYAYYDKTKEYNVGDGSRGFAWWLERYLRILRTQYTTEYNKIAGDTCWRQLMLANWGRMARRWDEIRKANMTEFSIPETFEVEALVNDPRFLAEIENLRVLDGCRK